MYVSCSFPLKYTIGKNVSVPRITLILIPITWV